MKERPILFSGEMVRAILEGRKSMTRRVVKPQPKHPHALRAVNGAEWCGDAGVFLWDAQWEDGHGRHREFAGDARCPYGQPGDRLWVRESWALEDCGRDGERITWRADRRAAWRATLPAYFYTRTDFEPDRWRPSIHMPRWASRITLEITDVRVERVQEISEADARAEGIPAAPPVMLPMFEEQARKRGMAGPHVYLFEELWNEINGPRGYGWDANPWVWVVSFRQVAS